MDSLKAKVIHGIKWTSLSTGLRSIIQIVQLLVLARFLSAEDFGLVAIVMIVIGFSQLFMDMGISNAIIHKEKITVTQLSSLYWLNILSGLSLTIIVYITSPLVASFYNEQAITPLLQLLSLSFLINSTGNQFRVLLRKNLKFDLLAKIEVFAVLFGGFVAILLAIDGYGAYSLVLATLLNVTVSNTILLVNGLKTNCPKFVYSYEEIKFFLNFGLYQIGQNSIVYFNKQFDVILIGKLLGTEILGAYSLTKQLVMRPAGIINPIVTNVTFPIMAKIQNDPNKLKIIYLKIINYLSSINFPIYILMATLASSIVPLVFGDKWLASVGIFQLLSVYYLIRSTTNPAGALLMAKGRADIGFWWSLGEFSLMPLIIYVGSFWGVIGVASSLVIFQILFLLPNWYFIVKKMCAAPFEEYFYTQVKPLMATLISVFIVSVSLNNTNFIPSVKILIFSFFKCCCLFNYF
jgi:O-antigen/teichoic acid export membrane protein